MENQDLVTICKNNEFRRIYSKGKYFVSPVVVIYVLKNRTGKVRVGVTTSKKIGNAVKRNRSRRIIKEAVRQLLPGLRAGYDYVFVARGKTPFLKTTDIKRNILSQLRKTVFFIEKQEWI